MAERQIFYDPSGRRRKRFRLAVILFVLLNLLTVTALFATIRVVPAEPPLPVALEHGVAQPAPKSSLLSRTGREVNLAISRLLGTQPPSPRRAGPRRATQVATAMSRPLYVGFYTPWDPDSVTSLHRHINDIDWLAPVWVTVTGPAHSFNALPDRDGRALLNSAAHRPLILPVIQNFQNGVVDSAGLRGLPADARLRQHFLDQLEPFLIANHASGAVFDFEDIDPAGQANYLELLREARQRFAPHAVRNAAELAQDGQEALRKLLAAYEERPAG